MKKTLFIIAGIILGLAVPMKSANNDRFIIGAGYYISDLDYYSGRRNVTLADGSKFWVPEKQLSQAIFLSVGYRF